MVSLGAEMVAEPRWRGQGIDALRALGDRVEVFQDVLDDFPEAKRDDGEIIATETDGWQTEKQTDCQTHEHCQRCGRPEAEAERIDIASQNGVAVRADGHERGDAEIELTGETGENVQAKSEHCHDENWTEKIADVRMTW